MNTLEKLKTALFHRKLKIFSVLDLRFKIYAFQGLRLIWELLKAGVLQGRLGEVVIFKRTLGIGSKDSRE